MTISLNAKKVHRSKGGHGLLKHSRIQKIIITAFFLTSFVTGYSQDATTYFNRGLEKEKAGRSKEAIKLFDKAIELNPGLDAAWSERGHIKMYLRDYDLAIADFTWAIKINSNNKTAWANRAATKFLMTDYMGSVADLDHAINLDSTDGKAYYLRGAANDKLGRTDAACADFKTALRLGITAVQERVDLCNGKAKIIDSEEGMMVLDEERDMQKLVALGPQLVIKERDTAMGIVFFLILSARNTNTDGRITSTLKSDSLSSIEIILENSESILVKKSQHNQLSPNQPLIFMALFDPGQKELLKKNNIQKISFYMGDDRYDYIIKDKYTNKIKDRVSMRF